MLQQLLAWCCLSAYGAGWNHDLLFKVRQRTNSSRISVFCFSRLFLDVFLDVLDVMDQRQGSLNTLLFVLGELSIIDLFSVMLSSSNLHFILTATVCGAFRTLTHSGINQKASSC